jgi:phosphoglycolate phosphatase
MIEKLAVFDLDGTLVDTAPDLIDTLNLQFVREGIEPIAFAEARNLIGGGVKRLIERALALRGAAALADETPRLYREFLDHYGAHIADRSRPFPGIERALDSLAADGWRLAVCTNKLEWLSIKLLEALNLRSRFCVVCGQDTYGVQKPDPDILHRTVADAGGRTAGTIMVGDSITDVETARAASIKVVAVDFGYSDVPVGRLGADRLISHFDELRSALEELMTTTAPGTC